MTFWPSRTCKDLTEATSIEAKVLVRWLGMILPLALTTISMWPITDHRSAVTTIAIKMRPLYFAVADTGFSEMAKAAGKNSASSWLNSPPPIVLRTPQ